MARVDLEKLVRVAFPWAGIRFNLATTINSNSFPQPFYDLAYLYAQQDNPDLGLQTHARQGLAALMDQSSVEGCVKEGRALDALAQPSTLRPHSHEGQGHDMTSSMQELESISAVQESHGKTIIADGASSSSRPKRVRTGNIP